MVVNLELLQREIDWAIIDLYFFFPFLRTFDESQGCFIRLILQ